MIKLQNICKTIPGSNGETRSLLENINLTIQAGESCSIIGRSGCGKTTLIKILAGLCTDYAGTYTFNDKKVAKKAGAAAAFRKANIGYITQQFYLMPQRTIRANVMIGNEAVTRKEVDAVLEKLSLRAVANQKVQVLSGGERQRVVIARALLKKPRVLLADEPTGSLDTETAQEVMAVFQQLMHDGVQCIIITHDIAIASLCQRRFQLENKTLREI